MKNRTAGKSLFPILLFVFLVIGMLAIGVTVYADDEGSIVAGDEQEFTLKDKGSEAVFQFDCTKSGVYNFGIYDKKHIENSSYPIPEIKYSFYEESGSKELVSGSNYERVSCGISVYLKEDTTYSIRLINGGYAENTLKYWYNGWGDKPENDEITLTLAVAYGSVDFKITNDSDSAATVDAALSMNDTLSYALTDELTEAAEIHSGNIFKSANRIPISLAPGKSVDITVIPSYSDDGNLNWAVSPKYQSGYETDGSSGTIQWDGRTPLETIDVTLKKTAVSDENDKTTFHSISDLTEMINGQHYIFAVKKDDKYYALAYDNNKYVTPVELKSTADGYTIDVSRQDIESGDFVLTSTSDGTVSELEATGLKFVTNYKDANGKKIYLKMGDRSGSDYHTLFNANGGGSIDIKKQNDQYNITHDVFGRLGLGMNGEEPYFTWKESCSDIIILTDADTPQQSDKPKGDQQFFRINTSDLYSNMSKPLLFVYKTDDGKYYAMTPDGARLISDPAESLGTEIAVTDFENSWTPMSITSSYPKYDDTNGFYKYTGFKRNDNYLNPAAETLVSENNEEIHIVSWCSGITPAAGSTFNQNPLISDASGNFIGWDNATSSFISTDDVDVNNAIQFQIYSYHPEYNLEKYYPVDDLSRIEDWSKVLLTCTGSDGNERIIMPSGNNGIVSGTIAGSAEDGDDIYYEADGKSINARSWYGLTLGELKSVNKQQYKLAYLRWKDSSKALYVDGFVKNYSLTASDDKECMLTYADGTQDIILRGAKQWLIYDTDNNTFITSDTKEDATPIHVWTINEPQGDEVTVNFHDIDGNIDISREARGSIVLATMPDMIKDDTKYTFVGWSTDKDKAGYLSLDDSCDLYDFDDKTDTGAIKADAANNLSIVGQCNPEETDSIDLQDIANGNEQLDLYPVYAVKGYSSAVTADEDDTEIVGISDWKDLEPGDHSQLDREKWLGRIYVNVYKDGEVWVKSAPMYFQYHNDDAADVNLKFISDELLENYKDEADPVYAYLSDPDVYPATSQNGNYVIDAVYASQGGSEDGLKYNYNWLTDHGGQLDNIEGGSTIDIYVTSLYQVEYYLDDTLLEDDAWNDTNRYSTPGTDSAFTVKAADANYLVEKDNEYHSLMDREITDGSTFVDDAIKRGGYSYFAYHIHDSIHVIPLAKLPDAPEGKVLTASTWEMKDKDGNIVATPAPSSDYQVTGTEYLTGNTVNAWLDDDDMLPTYHLHAYSKEPSDDDTPDEPDTPDQPNPPDKPDTPVKPDAPQDNAAKTEDTTPMYLLLTLVLLSAIGGTFTIVSDRRKGRSGNTTK